MRNRAARSISAAVELVDMHRVPELDQHWCTVADKPDLRLGIASRWTERCIRLVTSDLDAEIEGGGDAGTGADDEAGAEAVLHVDSKGADVPSIAAAVARGRLG